MALLRSSKVQMIMRFTLLFGLSVATLTASCSGSAECSPDLSVVCASAPDAQPGPEELPKDASLPQDAPSLPADTSQPVVSVPTLFAVLSSEFNPLPGNPPPSSSLEMVDLETHSMVRTLDLGARMIPSLAVAPNGSVVYLADKTNNKVSVINARTGSEIGSVGATSPRDLVLSRDGSKLYVTTNSAILEIDAATQIVRNTLATGSDTPLGVALSPDGRRLGAASQAGSNPAALLIDTKTFVLEQRVPIVGLVGGCGTVPSDLVFSDTRALLWDSNCDALYKVDLNTQTQIVAESIATGRDTGSSSNYNNRIVLSGTNVYALKEENRVVLMSEIGTAFSLMGDFTGTVSVPAVTPADDGIYISVIHRFSSGGADTLDFFDVAGRTFTRGIYTFSTKTQMVRDMRIVLASR